MKTSTYFAIPPIAAGTLAVECLSSLLHRVAVAHGVTRHQFIKHLREWWAREEGRHLPRCEELRWDGYSPNVQLGLSALKDATGLDLSSCTLIALRNSCAANFIGSIKHIRSWCPACFRDDLSSRGDPYDRLLWRIQGIDRCSVHRHKLISQCPHCGALQKNDNRPTDLHHCSACKQTLVTSYGRAAYLARPSFGEAQIERLVASLSDIRKTAPLPLHRFFASLEIERQQLEEDLGDLFHSRWHPPKPQLTSLIAVAVYFDVDVVQLITEPEVAASQATFPFKRVLPKRRSRPFSLTGHDRSAWFEKELKLVIEAGPPYPTVPEFCRSRDFSHQAARATFSKLIRELSLKRREWIAGERQKVRNRALDELRSLGRDRALMTEREVVRRVAERAGAPVHVVRALVRSAASDTFRS